MLDKRWRNVLTRHIRIKLVIPMEIRHTLCRHSLVNQAVVNKSVKRDTSTSVCFELLSSVSSLAHCTFWPQWSWLVIRVINQLSLRFLWVLLHTGLHWANDFRKWFSTKRNVVKCMTVYFWFIRTWRNEPCNERDLDMLVRWLVNFRRYSSSAWYGPTCYALWVNLFKSSFWWWARGRRGEELVEGLVPRGYFNSCY